MSLNIEERYKLIFNEHHYASDFRVRIFKGWCIIYAALATVFVWIQSASKTLSWIVTAVAIVITVLMWIADIRNRSAIHASKSVGVEIEKDNNAGIPDNQRFFTRLVPEKGIEKVLTHSLAIDIFSIVIIIFLFITTIYLLYTRGVLPS